MTDPITDPADAPSDDNLVDGRPGDTVPGDSAGPALTTDDAAQDEESEAQPENS